MALVSLTNRNFFKEERGSRGVWLSSQDPTCVLFITPRCPHCSKFISILSRIAQSVRPKIGIMNVGNDKTIVKMFSDSPNPLTRVPRFMIYLTVNGKRRSVTYKGPIASDKIYQFIVDNDRQASQPAQSRPQYREPQSAPRGPEYYRPNPNNPTIRPTQRRDISYGQQGQANVSPTDAISKGRRDNGDARAMLSGKARAYNKPWDGNATGASAFGTGAPF